MNAPRLVLASGSPRRRELLTVAGFDFLIDAADIDETISEGEAPDAATSRLALGKAEAVVARRAAAGRTEDPAAGIAQGAAIAEAPGAAAGEVVLAADTTVVIGGTRILGKPRDKREAVEMLLSLAGRNHEVLTAWALLETGGNGSRPQCGITRSTVRMREISHADAVAYAESGEPMDKAGAYAAQGEGRRFIGAIVGPLDNVIGLPMEPVVEALARVGVFPGARR